MKKLILASALSVGATVGATGCDPIKLPELVPLGAPVCEVEGEQYEACVLDVKNGCAELIGVCDGVTGREAELYNCYPSLLKACDTGDYIDENCEMYSEALLECIKDNIGEDLSEPDENGQPTVDRVIVVI